jgi:hypothetical protein
MPTYDKHYRKPEYFGNPYPELVKFFSEYEPKGNLLDLGCGQERDCARAYLIICAHIDHAHVELLICKYLGFFV